MAANKEKETDKDAEAENAAAADAKGGGGKFSAIQAWLPLIAAIVVMPVLAYVTTSFVLVPKLQAIAGANTDHGPGGDGQNPDHAGGEEAGDGHGGKSDGHGEQKELVKLSKLLVNVAGTRATRYLMTSFVLVGHTLDFKEKVEANDALLRHIAGTHLSTKTITDLEKPGARNLIRSELISLFNEEIGKGMVKEIYFTEFAVQ